MKGERESKRAKLWLWFVQGVQQLPILREWLKVDELSDLQLEERWEMDRERDRAPPLSDKSQVMPLLSNTTVVDLLPLTSFFLFTFFLHFSPTDSSMPISPCLSNPASNKNTEPREIVKFGSFYTYS